MTDYTGPERRAFITFTREDSDRLVRLEEQNLAIMIQLTETHKVVAALAARINKVEKLQSWIMGIGSAITFMITTAVMWLAGKH